MEPQTQTLFDSQPSDNISRRQDEQHVKSGANWFYLIAGLSLVTSIISLVGGGWAFFVSLGITQIIDSFANALTARWGGGSVKIVAFLFDVLAAGAFALMGYFASKRQTWAFLVGMVLYALDALVFLGLILVFDSLSLSAFIMVAFHAYVLWKLFSGYAASARLVASGGGNLPPSPPPVATPV
ncbi:MAG TPA: hypothetical protein VGP08_18675 [Pyrinomonadaceae bacterium]|jgi:hypothetical protein|nr:hypothetical protein [Pyrinomonadaceae bacterium]